MKKRIKINKTPSSYRDPNGFVFFFQDHVYRQISFTYEKNYELFINSGLYQRLVDKGYLISHKEVNKFPKENNVYKIIEPDEIPFITYPYEWCFSELKDAALLTLKIQKEALLSGMTLKDASSFNIQFLSGKPIFIDTLSFEKYEEGKPWVAYKQFCEQFLAPLTLSAYSDVRLSMLLKVFMEGIPLDLASNILPLSAKLNPFVLLHIILHSRSYRNITENKKINTLNNRSFTKNAFMGLIDSLEEGIGKLSGKKLKSIWTTYSDKNVSVSYKDKSFEAKKNLVSTYLDSIISDTLWDIGANIGIYSRLAAKKGIFTISIDADSTVIEKSYLQVKQSNENNILPYF